MLRQFLPLLGSRYRVRQLLTVLLICALLSFTLSSLKSGPSAASALEDERPHYLHSSSFRANPNHDYEFQLSRALRDLEHQERSLHWSEGTPDAIWQIYLGKEPNREQRGEDSIKFEERNWDWQYKLITTEWADEFITVTLSSIPGLAKLYYSYPHHVLRADLLRYLVLWYYGGYYADMDVFPKRTIKKCPSLQNSVYSADQPDISLVIGIEIDEPFASPQKMRLWHWVRRYGFIQYNIYAPKRFSPILRELIVRVLSHTQSHLDSGGIFRGAAYNEKNTLEITGPGVFTDTVLDVLSDTLPISHPLVAGSVEADDKIGDLVSQESKATQRVTWAPFNQLSEPLCVDASEAKSGTQLGGLCVLPINAWGNGQRHSGAENFFSQHACINHRFGGTWKPWKQSWKKKIFG